MTIRAWKSEYQAQPGQSKDVTFAVGQTIEKAHRFASEYAGTSIDVTGPSYRNNFHGDERGSLASSNRGERDRSTLFDYEPGKVIGMFNDVRTPHTAGVAMGLAAQWHRTQGGELNVGHGMPTYDQSLSSDSAPIAKRLVTRGLVPTNVDNADIKVTNTHGRNDSGARGHEIHPNDWDTEVGPEEMRGARETLREVFGKKRTAPIQQHYQKSQGEQLKLV